MKIAITGAMCTGKTTLVAELSKIYGLPIIPEVARLALAAGFKLDQGDDVRPQMWIALKQLLLEKSVGDNWVADRCLIDVLAYSTVLLGEQNETTKIIRDVATEYVPSYDYIIYLPCAQFSIEDDGVRLVDEDEQRRLDSAILAAAQQLNLTMHTVVGTVQERVEKIQSIIVSK